MSSNLPGVNFLPFQSATLSPNALQSSVCHEHNFSIALKAPDLEGLLVCISLMASGSISLSTMGNPALIKTAFPVP